MSLHRRLKCPKCGSREVHIWGESKVKCDDCRHVASWYDALSFIVDAAYIVRAVNCHDDLVTALEAIKARLDGEWDNPALVKFGPLQGTTQDVWDIANEALTKAKE